MLPGEGRGSDSSRLFWDCSRAPHVSIFGHAPPLPKRFPNGLRRIVRNPLAVPAIATAAITSTTAPTAVPADTCPATAALLPTADCTACYGVGMSRLFDARRYRRRLSVSMPDHTADELHGLAATAGVPVSALIREALRRSLPAIRREIKRHAAEEGK